MLFDPGSGTGGDVLEFMVNGGGLEFSSNPHSASQPFSDSAAMTALAEIPQGCSPKFLTLGSVRC
jgi:hypothetical protein